MAQSNLETMAEDHAEQYRPETGTPPKTLSDILLRAAVDPCAHTSAHTSAGACDAETFAPVTHQLGRLRITEAAIDRASLASAGEPTAPMVGAWIQLAGAAQLRQGERVAELRTGDLCLLRGARPLALQATEPGRVLLVEVPEQELADRFTRWRFALVQRIRATTGAPAVFRDAVQSIQRWRDALVPGMQGSIACAIVDLIGAMICFAAPLNPACVGRALFQQDRIRSIAREQLRNPDLSVDLIAESVGLSPRQIHRIFANEPLSLMRWIWVQRLEHCYRDLREPGTHQRSIAEIAYAWGFNDQAHFSRAFRRHFGATPREVRLGAVSQPLLTASARSRRAADLPPPIANADRSPPPTTIRTGPCAVATGPVC